MNRKTLIVMVALLSLVFAATVPAMAQTPAPTTVPQPATATPPPMMATTKLFVTSNFLANVRSGPGTEYTILGKTRQGDALDITGKLADSSWLRVNFNGQEGWVLASLFNPTGDLTKTSDAVAGSGAVLRTGASTTISTTTQAGDVFGTTTGSVNLRAMPSTKGDVLVIVPFSTQLTATGRTSASNWVKVTYDNKTGWITSAVYSVLRGKVANLPVFDEAGVAVPATAQPTSKPQATVQPTATK